MDKIKLISAHVEKAIDTTAMRVLDGFKKYVEGEVNVYRLDSPRGCDEECPFFTITEHCYENGHKVIIEGNLRKWFFGLNNLGDLDYYQYKGAIEWLSRLIFGDNNSLWDFKVTQIELGYTIRLPKHFTGVIDAYVAYSSFKKVWYEGETSSFQGRGYTMNVYDKALEVERNRMKRFGSSIKDPKPIRKIRQKVCHTRYEMKIHSLSKVPEFINLVATPGDILENWDLMLDTLKAKFNNITYMDFISPERTFELRGKRQTPIKEYIMMAGIMAIGRQRVAGICDLAHSNDKARLKKYFEGVHERVLGTNHLDLKRDLKRTISRRVRKLKAND
jgi:hypothetical protein